MQKLIEWDKEKAKSNLQKHGVSFDEAMLIFNYKMIERIDDKEDYGEDRYIAHGYSGYRVLIVVYAEYFESIRIISARKGDKHDSDFYFSKIYS